MNSDLTRPDRRLRVVLEAIDAGRPFAWVTVIATDGSTPAVVGGSMLISADGSQLGTVGGGPLEAEARRRALEAIASQRASILEFGLHGAGVQATEPVCGGEVALLIDPSAAASRAACAQALHTLECRKKGCLLTSISGADHLQVESTFVPEMEIGSHALEPGPEALRSCLSTERPRLFPAHGAAPGPTARVFAAPLIPTPRLLIAGGGHVGQAIAAQASLVGYDLVVLDDRPEFTQSALFPAGVRTICGSVVDELTRFPLDEDTFVVLVTRGHQHDTAALAACVRRPLAYLGMIGSRRKVGLLRREFLARGWATAEEFDRVYAPVGLDLGAATVPEIAASIVAQLIAVRRRGKAPRIALNPAPPP